MHAQVFHHELTDLLLRSSARAEHAREAALRYRLARRLDDHYFDLCLELGTSRRNDPSISALDAARRALGTGDDLTVVASHLRAHVAACPRHDGPVNDTEARYGADESPS